MDDPQPEPFLPFLDQLDITLWTNSVSASLDSLPHSGIDTGLLSLETFLELSSRSRHAEGKKDDNLSVTSSMDDSAYMSQPDTLRSPLERTYKAVPASAITRSNLFDSNSQSFGLDLQAHTVVQTQALQADPGVFLSTTGKSRHTRSSYGMQRTSPDDSLPLYSIQDHLLLSPDLSYDTKGLGPWETTARQFAHSNGATGHLDRNSAFANDIGFLPQQNSDSLDYLYPSLGFAQDTGLNFSSLETGPAATEQEAVSKVFKKKGPVSGVNGRYSISEDQTPPCPQGSGNLIRRESDPGASIQSHLESTRRLPQRQPVPTIETGNWSRNGAAGNSASDLSSKRVDYVQGQNVSNGKAVKSCSESSRDAISSPHGGAEVPTLILDRETGETQLRLARTDPLYQASPMADNLYHCPYESSNCGHEPAKLKCKYDKHIDSHLRPFRCNAAACVGVPFSSAACVLRHEREAHGMYGAKANLCHYANCERSIPGSGFPRKYNLFDHMKRMHGHVEAESSEGSAEASKESVMPQAEDTIGARKRKHANSPVEESKKNAASKARKARANAAAAAEQSRTARITELKSEWHEQKAGLQALLGSLDEPQDVQASSQFCESVNALQKIAREFERLR